MFTYNLEQHFQDEITHRLRDLIRPYIEDEERRRDQIYGEALMRVASPQYRRHMEQRIATWEEMSN